jgi:hypothetical protein
MKVPFREQRNCCMAATSLFGGKGTYCDAPTDGASQAATLQASYCTYGGC